MDENLKGSDRVSLTIPRADTSVLRWLDAQDNKSVSIRAVIRDYIERHGYSDPLCLPVEQAPRRGRPPMNARIESVTDEFGDDGGDDDTENEVSTRPRPRATAPKNVVPKAGPARPKPRPAPKPQSQPESNVSSDDYMDNPLDMNDILGQR